ncbi:MAG: ribokinase [Bryobacterales bacterium]|nr:ribokinase [Bryobacterales bacterium]
MPMSNKRIFVLGSANVDFVIPLDRLPREGETLAGGDLTIFPGGKGANQAYAAARLGGNVAMIAAVGLDAFGTELLEKLSAGGVDISLVERSDRPTGCACIYVLPAGRNAIVISPGANAMLDPETAMSKLQSLSKGDFLLAQLETPLETVEAAFAYAKYCGATTVLDPAPARCLPVTLLANVDILTPNQTEAGILLGAPQLQIENFKDADIVAERLLGLGPRAVMLKLGGVGCLYSNGSERARAEAFRVNPVDTTAAGDEFNAALSVILAEGASMPFAMRFANAAAAISVTRPGAQSSAPDRIEVEQFLEYVPVP